MTLTEEEARMLATVEGMYEDGRIVLTEKPPEVSRCRVLVTFVAPTVDQQPGALRAKLLASLAIGLEELHDRDVQAR